MTLAEELAALEDLNLSTHDCAVRATEIIWKHRPKKYRDWSKLLREVADYIDAHPAPTLLTAKQLGGLLALEGFK